MRHTSTKGRARFVLASTAMPRAIRAVFALHPGNWLVDLDPISKKRIAEMQKDIDSKMEEGLEFKPAGPAGW